MGHDLDLLAMSLKIVCAEWIHVKCQLSYAMFKVCLTTMPPDPGKESVLVAWATAMAQDLRSQPVNQNAVIPFRLGRGTPRRQLQHLCAEYSLVK